MKNTTVTSHSPLVMLFWLRPLRQNATERCVLCGERASFQVHDYNAATEVEREQARGTPSSETEQRVWQHTCEEQREHGPVEHQCVRLCRKDTVFLLDDFLGKHVGTELIRALESEQSRAFDVSCALLRIDDPQHHPVCAFVKGCQTMGDVLRMLAGPDRVEVAMADGFDPYAALGMLLDAVEAKRSPNDEVARDILRLATAQALGRFALARASGRTPSVRDAFHGNSLLRMQWQREHGGAISTLIILATVLYAEIGLDGQKDLSRQPVAVDTAQLRRLMRFVATDPGMTLDPEVLPYSQVELRRAYEEWLVEEHPLQET